MTTTYRRRWGASETVIRTTVRVKIPVTIEIEVRVPADGSEPTIDDFEWGVQVVDVDHHWSYDDAVCEEVLDASRAVVAAHRQALKETTP